MIIGNIYSLHVKAWEGVKNVWQTHFRCCNKPKFFATNFISAGLEHFCAVGKCSGYARPLRTDIRSDTTYFAFTGVRQLGYFRLRLYSKGNQF